MAELILSAFSDEYADGFSEQLAAMKRLGIDYIELRFVNKKNVSALTGEEVETVRRQLKDAGIRVSAIGSPLGKVAIDGDWQTHLDQTKRICETACRLDSCLVRMFSFYLPEGEAPERYRDQVIDSQLVAIGEVGLTGEIRSVSNMNQRLGEVARLGFKKCIIPRNGSEKLDIPAELTVYRVRNICEAIETAL